MTLVEVLAAVTCRGVRLVIAGGEMRARAPKGAVDEALRQGLAEHKQTIIETFGERPRPSSAPAPQLIRKRLTMKGAQQARGERRKPL
jgi:predicted metal-dependent hydrolase